MQILEEKFELLDLKISLHVEGRQNFVQLELESNKGGSRQLVDTWRVSVDELGLPIRLSPREMPAFHLPQQVLDSLAARVQSFGFPRDHPLWLHIVKPNGYLGVVDWERLLVPVLGHPLLRLPDFLERPRENRSTLNVALCCSAPLSEPVFYPPDLIRTITVEIIEKPARPDTNVHIFADLASFADLSQHFAGDNRVIVHDPQTAAVHGEQERTNKIPDTARTIRSPWLLWIRDAMEGQSLDAVHFICHGFLAGDRPAVSFTESPLSNSDRRDARYIGVAELSTFLTQTGAWSAIFADPPQNYSEVGLRLLADTLAQARPGPVLYYHLGGMDIGAAFRFLFGRDPGRAPVEAEMFMYCQPELVATQSIVKTTGAPEVIDINAGLFEGSVRGIIPVSPEQTSVPRWIAAAQRHVESVSLDLQRRRSSADVTSSGVAPSSINAASETLKELQNIVADYARDEGVGLDNWVLKAMDANKLRANDMRTLEEEH